MSSIMRARSGLTGRGEVAEVIGALSRAEGCWPFDARDRMPRSSRATAHYLVENTLTVPRAPSRASGFVLRRFADDRLFLRRPLADQIADDHQSGGDPDARLQLDGFDIEATDGVDQTQPRPDRP